MNNRVYKIKLSKIAYVCQGQSPKSIFYSTSEGVPFLQGNRTFGNIYPIIDTYTTKVTKIAKKGDVLMSVRAPVGDLNIAPFDLCIGRGLASIIAKNGNSKFIYYALKYNIKNLLRQGAATTFDSVIKDTINNFELIIPEDENYRNRVESLLSNIDAKVELNNCIISELDEMVRSVYYHWFVQFDFPNEDGKPYKSSGGKMIWIENLKKAIPSCWSVDKISSLVKQNKGGDWGKDEPTGNYIKKVSCIRGADINYIIGNVTNSNMPERYILEKNAHKLLLVNDIVIEISGGSPIQSTGRAAIITEKTIERFDNPLICSNFCQAITLKDDNYSGFFFYMWSMFYDHNIFFNYEGKTSGIKNFLFDSFMANEWYIPTQTIAHKFQQTVNSIYKKKESLLQQNKHLTACRDWLLPLLMSGQVKIKPQIEESVLNIAAEPSIEYHK